MDLNLKKLKENADPNCKKCKGKGWIPDKNKGQNLGSGTMKINDNSFPVQDVHVNLSLKRMCPLCFDPDGKPRDGRMVKK